MKQTLSILFFIIISICVQAQTQPVFMAINKDQFQEVSVNHPEYNLDAKANTNLFITHDKQFNVVNIPMLLQEVNGDFVLQAKVTPALQTKWDAGVLLAYVNDSMWAKLCFEKSVEGPARMVTVVNNIVSDDSNSDIVTNKSIYMRIVRVGKSFRFSFSADKKDWFVLRYFTLNNQEHLKVGIGSQSPAGNGCKTQFEELELITEDVEPYWNNKK